MPKRLVVAGTREQFERHRYENRDDGIERFYIGPRGYGVRGRHDYDDYEVVGTYWDRRDLTDVVDMLRSFGFEW